MSGHKNWPRRRDLKPALVGVRSTGGYLGLGLKGGRGGGPGAWFCWFSPFLHRQGGCSPVSFLAVMLPCTTACSPPSRQNTFCVSRRDTDHRDCCPDRWCPEAVGNTLMWNSKDRERQFPTQSGNTFLCTQTLSLLTLSYCRLWFKLVIISQHQVAALSTGQA